LAFTRQRLTNFALARRTDCRTLTQPKNALVKQYQRLFEMESIDLTLVEEALSAIARKAIDRKTGARGTARRGPRACSILICLPCTVKMSHREFAVLHFAKS
jgi:hypothetical protein